MMVAQIAALASGGTLLGAAMAAVMNRALRREREHMQRRRQAWIDAGSIPEDEPKFYPTCSGGS